MCELCARRVEDGAMEFFDNWFLDAATFQVSDSWGYESGTVQGELLVFVSWYLIRFQIDWKF